MNNWMSEALGPLKAPEREGLLGGSHRENT